MMFRGSQDQIFADQKEQGLRQIIAHERVPEPWNQIFMSQRLQI
jgi:hypothetical protein